MSEMNEMMKYSPEEERKEDVILAVLRLSRALRRCPPEHREKPFPPAVGRLLSCVGQNSGVSSRELCELLDLRPSSLSELLSRGEAAGLLIRTADENDRRIQHVSLSDKGREIIQRMETERAEDAREKTACFTAEEAHRFCELSEKLTSHLESLAASRPLPEDRPPRGCRGPEDFGPGGRGPGRHGRPGPGGPGFGGRDFGPHGFDEQETPGFPGEAPDSSPEADRRGPGEEETHRRFPEGARFRS